MRLMTAAFLEILSHTCWFFPIQIDLGLFQHYFQHWKWLDYCYLQRCIRTMHTFFLLSHFLLYCIYVEWNIRRDFCYTYKLLLVGRYRNSQATHAVMLTKPQLSSLLSLVRLRRMKVSLEASTSVFFRSCTATVRVRIRSQNSPKSLYMRLNWILMQETKSKEHWI